MLRDSIKWRALVVTSSGARRYPTTSQGPALDYSEGFGAIMGAGVALYTDDSVFWDAL